MVITARTVKGLAQRLAKAEALVADGAVFPVAGMDGVYAVRGSDGSSVHLVDTRAGRERCTCPDYQQRQGPAGLSCKHMLAAELAGRCAGGIGRCAEPARPAQPVEPDLVATGISLYSRQTPRPPRPPRPLRGAAA